MGTFSPVFDRLARPVAFIKAEDEALGCAHLLAETAMSADDGSYEKTILDHLLRSGLLGISVSTDYGGIDVSNVLLSTICCVLAKACPTLGAMLAGHYSALELLRSHGSEAQKSYFFAAALAGMRLARVKAPSAASLKDRGLHLSYNGLGWSLNGTGMASPNATSADWIMVSVHDQVEEPAHLFFPGGTATMTPIANSLSDKSQPDRGEPVLFRDQRGEKDGQLQTRRPAQGPDVPQAMELLLQAAVELGRGKAAFSQLFGRPVLAPSHLPDDTFEPDFDPSKTGAIADAALRLATAEAVIEKAASAIDAAQIGTQDRHRHTAFLIASAANAAAVEASTIAQSVAADPRFAHATTPLGGVEFQSAEAAIIVSLLRKGTLGLSGFSDDDSNG
ncbi:MULTISPECIES: acyl-CoA dehydrogenase family protein [Rhizobium/Agrobacterium group]|uniref:acyl-CoA dehydrogenase family protein n=1 Tax=Rhizobium/Agrobacterium group TaxID=227290 RepID=UPI000B4039C6|nr:MULTISPECIES: acyl-CoA dehydrogenase family protein [Rhizobium/Agrobacterium group]NSZ44942.1 hypothetical protein [Agrobacterium vitis]NTA28689.1 hypothetical protein [Allorhizobium ampelinum]OVE93286.1 hypothetical protein B7W85_19520 [Allorhizobium ampelinum]